MNNKPSATTIAVSVSDWLGQVDHEACELRGDMSGQEAIDTIVFERDLRRGVLSDGQTLRIFNETQGCYVNPAEPLIDGQSGTNQVQPGDHLIVEKTTQAGGRS
jgi:hypothetical protein